mgnify:FL=1
MVAKGQRKVRSDAKKDVKSTLPIELKDAIYRLAFLTNTPVMHVAELLFVHSIRNAEIVDRIATQFQREVLLNGKLYRGSLSNPAVSKQKYDGQTDRIHFRLSRESYEILAVFAYALACSHSKACAVLLEECIHESDFISNYVEQHLEDNLSKDYMNELREFMRYVNKGEEIHSWASLLSYIKDEVKKPFKEVKDLVEDFVIHHWRDQ